MLRFCICLVLAAGIPGILVAAEKSGAASYALCASCHGALGQGQRALGAPALANLDAEYLERQILNFRSKRRGGKEDSATAQQMQAMAAVLTDDDAVTEVARYIESLPTTVTAATVEGDLATGQSQYSMICGACHGGRAEGNDALEAPALAGVDDWYLMSQLKAFKNGVRGLHADDRLGAQMRSMAAVLVNERAARDVVSYIRSLENQ